jgi:5-methylcytosine-specific restriction endonuclease McrA
MERALKQLVWARADARCEYCRMLQDFDPLPFEIDHIVPVVHGGKTTPGNTALSCFQCNRHKGTNVGGLDPITRKLTRLYNPRRHSWSRHFNWSGPRLEGRTAIGRVTIEVLAINDYLRVWHRRELFAEGAFPQ